MNLDDIEYAICLGEINAAKVFTLMKQHMSAEGRRSHNEAVKEIADFVDKYGADGETIRQQFLSA